MEVSLENLYLDTWIRSRLELELQFIHQISLLPPSSNTYYFIPVDLASQTLVLLLDL